MHPDTPYARAFRRAIETLGGPEPLANAVDASVDEIEAWAAGHSQPPLSAFLKAIDVIAQGAWVPGGSAES